EVVPVGGGVLVGEGGCGQWRSPGEGPGPLFYPRGRWVGSSLRPPAAGPGGGCQAPHRGAAFDIRRRPPAVAPKSLSAGAESLSLIANPVATAGGPPSGRRAASKSTEKLRDKEPWPTKGFPSLHASRYAAAAISHRTARSFDRSQALPPTPASSSPSIAAWC